MPKLTRNDLLSCSQLPAIMGLSPYATPNNVLKTIVDAINGEHGDNKTNEAMEWGNRIELAIIQKMAEVLGVSFETPDAPYYWEDKLGASLDALAYSSDDKTISNGDMDKVYVMTPSGTIRLNGRGCLEAKNTKVIGMDKPEMFRGPIQLQGQMLCSGTTWGAIGTLYQGHDFRLYLYEVDEEMRNDIMLVAKDVAARVEAYNQSGEPEWYPIASSSDANLIYDNAVDKEVVLDMSEDISVITDAKAQIEALQADISIAETRIKTAMRSATRARIGGYMVSWPMRHYKAQPEKLVPAKDAYEIRQSTLTIKEIA